MNLKSRLQSRGARSPASLSPAAIFPDPRWLGIEAPSSPSTPPEFHTPEGFGPSTDPAGPRYRLANAPPPWGRFGGAGVEPPPGMLPTLRTAHERIDNIGAGQPALFEITGNPDADGSAPLHENAADGRAAVTEHDAIIVEEARSQSLDPDLLRAVIYLENARGGAYGRPSDTVQRQLPDWVREDVLSHFGLDKPSILPMNIQPSTWGSLGLDHDNAFDPVTNIRAGATLLRRIVDRLPDPDPAKVGSNYNFTGRERVNDYGAALDRIYREKPWLVQR